MNKIYGKYSEKSEKLLSPIDEILVNNKINIEKLQNPWIWLAHVDNGTMGDTDIDYFIASEHDTRWILLISKYNWTDKKLVDIDEQFRFDNATQLVAYLKTRQEERPLRNKGIHDEFCYWLKKNENYKDKIDISNSMVDTSIVYISCGNIYRHKQDAIVGLIKSNDWVSYGSKIRTYDIDKQCGLQGWYGMDLSDKDLEDIGQHDPSLLSDIKYIFDRKHKLIDKKNELMTFSEALHSCS